MMQTRCCTNVLKVMYSQLLRRSAVSGLVPDYPWEVPLRSRLVSLFYSLNVLLNLKIKNACLIMLSHWNMGDYIGTDSIEIKRSLVNFYLIRGQLL